MTTAPAGAAPLAGPPALAERVAEAVLAVPGVTGLSGGPFGVGTYLPGRRVLGIRLGERSSEVHVTVAFGTPIPALADTVIAVVEPMVTTPVSVVVEDVTSAEPV